MIHGTVRVYDVKTALSNLYDPVGLDNNPLIDLLHLRTIRGIKPSEALRKILRKAIDSLQPSVSFAPGQSEWVGYSILQMRYLRGQDVDEICRELVLSKATFYRRHHEAIEAIVCIIQGQVMEREAELQGEEALGREPTAQTSLIGGSDEAVKVARRAPREMVDQRAVLEDAALIFIPLASERGIACNFSIPATLPPACVDPAMFHQIVLNVLLEGLRLASGSELRLSVQQQGKETQWRLTGLRSDADLSMDSPELALGDSLLRVYGGRLWFDCSGSQGPALYFAFPCTAPRSVLLIDDDDDTVELYRRYLQSAQYQVRTVPSVDALSAAFANELPDIILLDVLMPHEDGWKLLQRIKTMPETRDIPVIICSVLSQPHLALALGASQVLQKPIDRQTLLQTVHEALREADK